MWNIMCPMFTHKKSMAEAFIKRLQTIARTLVMRTKLLVSAWGYAIFHAAMLVRLRPIATQPHSLLQLVTGYEPDVSHLRVFKCAIYVPIVSPLRTKMGPQRKIEIYVDYDSPSIVHYLEPLTGDLFTTHFADCHFDEIVFPSLGGDKHANVPVERRELSWYSPTMSHLDPRIAQSETEVHRIIDFQSIAQSVPDAFNDLAKVTISHILAANTPARIDVPAYVNNPPGKAGPSPKVGRPHPPRCKVH